MNLARAREPRTLEKGYNWTMAKNVIHVTDAEASRDFAWLLDRVRAGAEVIIERDSLPVAVVRPAEAPRGRLLSEVIALAAARGSTVTLDGGYARDVEAGVESHREPLNPPSWD